MRAAVWAGGVPVRAMRPLRADRGSMAPMSSMMRRVVLVSCLLGASCGGGGSKPAAQEPAPANATSDQALSNTQPAGTEAAPAAPATPAARALAKMREYEAALCACQDSPCVQAVADDMTRWSNEEARKAAAPPKLTEQEEKQAAEIGARMGECMQRAMTTKNP